MKSDNPNPNPNPSQPAAVVEETDRIRTVVIVKDEGVAGTAFCISYLLCIFFTPLCGFCALFCYNSRQGIKGAFWGTGTGFITYGIAMTVAGAVVVNYYDQIYNYLNSQPNISAGFQQFSLNFATFFNGPNVQYLSNSQKEQLFLSTYGGFAYIIEYVGIAEIVLGFFLIIGGIFMNSKDKMSHKVGIDSVHGIEYRKVG